MVFAQSRPRARTKVCLAVRHALASKRIGAFLAEPSTRATYRLRFFVCMCAGLPPKCRSVASRSCHSAITRPQPPSISGSVSHAKSRRPRSCMYWMSPSRARRYVSCVQQCLVLFPSSATRGRPSRQLPLSLSWVWFWAPNSSPAKQRARFQLNIIRKAKNVIHQRTSFRA